MSQKHIQGFLISFTQSKILFNLRNNKLVKIFGTVKAYKKEKNLQGAKILYVEHNEFLSHQIAVINDWLYLTGRLGAIKFEVNFYY